jgi:hypothetical protein
MKPLLLLLLTGCLAGGCAKDQDPVDAGASPTRHRLTWEVFNGTGDPATAVFILDGERLGKGAEGLRELRERITRMPRGTHVDIWSHYGDDSDGVHRVYPFDEMKLERFAEQYGVWCMTPNFG